MSLEDHARWRNWLEAPTQRDRAFDPIENPRDPAPAVVSKLRELYSALRHPRSFYRKVIVGSTLLLGTNLFGHL
jgi:hypothetical protein